MFRLAHLSDPHLGPLPEPTLKELASKRVLGYINWQRNRAGKLTPQYLNGLLTDIADQNVDHIAVTGDVINLALDDEIPLAAEWLGTLGSPDRVSLVPGNHDAYVAGALDTLIETWAPFMSGDDPAEAKRFPYMRARGPVAIVGASSAEATAPFMATGYFRAPQAARLEKLLRAAGERDLFRVILIHHPPVRDVAVWPRGLIGGSRFRDVIRRVGAELILHGHTHKNDFKHIPGPNGPVPVIGISSASFEPGTRRAGAAYNLFEIERNGAGFRCVKIRRGHDTPTSGVVEQARDELGSAT